LNLVPYFEALARAQTLPVAGSLTKIVGITVECRGLGVRLGELCAIETADGGTIHAEAIGFRDETTILMPLADLEGVGPGTPVRPLGRRLDAPAGEELLGRVLDGLGRPMDGGAPLHSLRRVPVHRPSIPPLGRTPIREVFSTGVRAIDGLLTLGKGQRIGIFAGAGVGKSTLLGTLARRSSASVTVIGLIGERGREVSDFVRDSLGEEGLARSVVVAAPSDAPPLQRLKAPFVATAIAEAFLDDGADVLLVMDSLTRFATAAREVGLALGEPPTGKGYPPSLFSHLPKLVERPGNFGHGSITGVYTVLVEGDDLTDPVADSLRALLDGHIVLSRSLAERAHFPSIDVLGSVSRLMVDLVSAEHRASAERFRRLLAAHRDAKDLIDVGAYRSGSDPVVDEAISKIDALNAFLRQDLSRPEPFESILPQLRSALGEAA
jgi:FliI/YscN family ATPase